MVHRSLLVAALGAVLAAAPARASTIRVQGSHRQLTVSGEPLVRYQLVDKGKTLNATADGPLVVEVMLRRHSHSRHRGRTEAALSLDGGEIDRFELPSEPEGRYLAGVGFAPGPETSRRIKLGPGRHRISVRAVGGALVVALQPAGTSAPLAVEPLVAAGAPALEAAPLVGPGTTAAGESPARPGPPAGAGKPIAVAPPAGALPHAGSSSVAPAGAGMSAATEPPATQPSAAQPLEARAEPAASAEPEVTERLPAVRSSEARPHWLLELRGGSASQTQVGATGFGGGLDVRYFVAKRFSIGIGADVFRLGYGTIAGFASPEAVSALSAGLSAFAVPIVAEGVYDQPLGDRVILSLGLGAGADYVQLQGNVLAGSAQLAQPASSSVLPAGAALVGLMVRIPSGRLGLELRLSSTLPQDFAGVARGAVVGAWLGEVGYQLVL